MGYYDFFNQKERYVMTGEYYPALPRLTTDKGYRVNYDIVDTRRKSVENVIANLPVENAIMTIRTNTQSDYATKSFFKAQDGKWFIILEVTIQPYTEESREALRLFKKGTQTEYVLRLMEYDYDGGAI